MSFWNIQAALLVFTAGFALFNEKWLRLPATIGIMLLATLTSLSLVALQQLGVDMATPVEQLVSQIHFDDTVLKGLIGFLMFSGGLSIDLQRLRNNALIIAILAVIGTVISTALVAASVYFSAHLFQFDLSLQDCLLFGALISPTDPIAVLSILRKVGAPLDLEMQIAGESLFNDGVGITLFLLFTHLRHNQLPVDLGSSLWLFFREALGGLFSGLLMALLVKRLLRGINNYRVIILIYFAVASGGFALARSLEISGALAMVAAGLVLGNPGRHYEGISSHDKRRVMLFWEVTDDLLNALLFMLLGMEFLLVFQLENLLPLLLVVPLVLASRTGSILLSLLIMHPLQGFNPTRALIMTWGGLRGALAVALALSLPVSNNRHLIVAMTYAVVLFSVLVQGTSLNPLIGRMRHRRDF
jgi:CPA1 family monovalent cation:H+ antiporter